MHANMLMLHIVHNVWQISDLMEWMKTWNNVFFFFFMIVGKVFTERCVSIIWICIANVFVSYIILMLSQNILHCMM